MPSFRRDVNDLRARLLTNGGCRARAAFPPAQVVPLRGMKECPLCGETMRLSVREIREAVPGAGASAARVIREWICPECDYFEEAEAGED